MKIIVDRSYLIVIVLAKLEKGILMEITKEEIIKKIMDTKLEGEPIVGRITVDLSDTELPFKYVAFDFSNEKYYWIAPYDYKKSGVIGHCQPNRTQNFVKTWKTFKGAKRNFINAQIR